MYSSMPSPNFVSMWSSGNHCSGLLGGCAATGAAAAVVGQMGTLEQAMTLGKK